MQNLYDYFFHIPNKKPYSIVICEAVYPSPYRVEGYDLETDPEIFGFGTLEECTKMFESLKNQLIEQGNYVVEVGCCVSKTQVPRSLCINYPPYEVWKVLYRNLNIQDQVRESDRIFTEGRKRIPPIILSDPQRNANS